NSWQGPIGGQCCQSAKQILSSQVEENTTDPHRCDASADAYHQPMECWRREGAGTKWCGWQCRKVVGFDGIKMQRHQRREHAPQKQEPLQDKEGVIRQSSHDQYPKIRPATSLPNSQGIR